MKRRFFSITTMVMMPVLLAGLSSCRKSESGKEATEAPGVGSIAFTANGEDFVRQGFVDKQGWSISFDHLYISIVDPMAYTPDGTEQVVLSGSHWVDLATGNEDAQPILLGTVDGAKAANYQSLRFALKRVASGPYAGSTIVMIGKAEREGTRVPFTIGFDEEMEFDGREGYVGDEIKGLLSAGGETDVEMTFHFDHVFGDIEAAAGDHINTGSVGFDFFHRFAEDGTVDVSQQQLRGAEGYHTLVEALWTLGHLGEGHCEATGQSSRDILK